MPLVVVMLFLAFSSDLSSAGPSGLSALVGTWIQDQVGPILTHERVYRFNPDGSYEYLFTARNTGSINRKILVRERGRFAVNGSRLVISPKSGRPKTFTWRIEKDPYVGDLRLVFALPDGTLDVYYRK
ncbi:MAG: hypothetical protein ACREJA_00725 [Candidatus Methylomirabilales bacterium]